MRRYQKEKESIKGGRDGWIARNKWIQKQVARNKVTTIFQMQYSSLYMEGIIYEGEWKLAETLEMPGGQMIDLKNRSLFVPFCFLWIINSVAPCDHPFVITNAASTIHTHAKIPERPPLAL